MGKVGKEKHKEYTGEPRKDKEEDGGTKKYRHKASPPNTPPSADGEDWEYSWEAVALALLICVGSGVMWLQHRTRGVKDPKWKEIVATFRPSLARQVEKRGEKVPAAPLMEEAALFLSEELGSRLQSSPDLIRQTAHDEGGAVPSRRVVQEVEFYSEFIIPSGVSTIDLRQRMNGRGFELLLHAKDSTPEYFVAFSPSRRLAVLSIVDSSCYTDFLDTLEHPPVPFLLTEVQAAAHKDIAQMAQSIVSNLRSTLLELFVPQNYQITIVGHGVGSGVGALVAVLLKEECNIKNVKACCVAPPACVDKLTALSSRSYITSVVHRSDAVPRSTLPSIKLLAGLVGGVASSLYSGGASKTRPQLLTILRDAQSSVQLDTPSLYVPGSVLYIYLNSTGTYSGSLSDGTLSLLRHFEITSTILSDHQLSSYELALRQLLARLPPDDPSWHWCGSSPPARGASLSPAEGRDLSE